MSTNLYESEIIVEDQSSEQRQQAIRQALEEVLKQVASVQEMTLANDVLDKALASAERYVQQYRYTGQGLWVRFDERSVDGLLQQRLDHGATTGAEMLLEVTGIHTLPDYTQVTNYLTSLKLIHGAQPQMVESDSIIFRIKAHSDRTTVARALAQDGFLQWMDRDAQILSFHYSP